MIQKKLCKKIITVPGEPSEKEKMSERSKLDPSPRIGTCTKQDTEKI